MKKIIMISLVLFLSSCASKTVKVTTSLVCTSEPEYLTCVDNNLKNKNHIISKEEFEKTYYDCCMDYKEGRL